MKICLKKLQGQNWLINPTHNLHLDQQGAHALSSPDVGGCKYPLQELSQLNLPWLVRASTNSKLSDLTSLADISYLM